jgi:hypothetical protein
VDRREKPAEKAGRPRAFLARMISSKRRMAGSEAGVRSRSWMNSLKARQIVSEKQDITMTGEGTYLESPAAWWHTLAGRREDS